MIVVMEEPLKVVVIQESKSNVHTLGRISLTLLLIHVHFIANVIHQDSPPKAPTYWLAKLLDILTHCFHLVFEEAKWNKSRGRESAVVTDNMDRVVVGVSPL